jgi:hypothetical protein
MMMSSANHNPGGAFSDLHLRHRGGSLLAGPSLNYPQVQFPAS